MQIRMQNAEGLTGPQMDEFLKSSGGIAFSGENRAGVYACTDRLLVAQEFAIQGKACMKCSLVSRLSCGQLKASSDRLASSKKKK